MKGIVQVAIITAAVAVAATAGYVVFRHARETGERVTAAIEQLAAVPDSVTGSAFWGRYQARREVLDAMRAYLQQLVALDSSLRGDSMYLGYFRQRAEQLPPIPSRVNFPRYAPYITRNGWYAWTDYWPISCAVAVGPDTTIRGAPSGTVVCYSVQSTADSEAFMVHHHFSTTHPNTEFVTGLDTHLVVRVDRRLYDNGVPAGWSVSVRRRDAPARNLLVRSTAFHGPHPSDVLAMMYVQKPFPPDRLLPVYGEPYELNLVCAECTAAGDSAREHFTGGRITVYLRKLQTRNPPPVGP